MIAWYTQAFGCLVLQYTHSKVNKCPRLLHLLSQKRILGPSGMEHDRQWRIVSYSLSYQQFITFTLIAFWVDTVCLDSVLILASQSHRSCSSCRDLSLNFHRSVHLRAWVLYRASKGLAEILSTVITRSHTNANTQLESLSCHTAGSALRSSSTALKKWIQTSWGEHTLTHSRLDGKYIFWIW